MVVCSKDPPKVFGLLPTLQAGSFTSLFSFIPHWDLLFPSSTSINSRAALSFFLSYRSQLLAASTHPDPKPTCNFYYFLGDDERDSSSSTYLGRREHVSDVVAEKTEPVR